MKLEPLPRGSPHVGLLRYSKNDTEGVSRNQIPENYGKLSLRKFLLIALKPTIARHRLQGGSLGRTREIETGTADLFREISTSFCPNRAGLQTTVDDRGP